MSAWYDGMSLAEVERLIELGAAPNSRVPGAVIPVPPGMFQRYGFQREGEFRKPPRVSPEAQWLKDQLAIWAESGYLHPEMLEEMVVPSTRGWNPDAHTFDGGCCLSQGMHRSYCAVVGGGRCTCRPCPECAAEGRPLDRGDPVLEFTLEIVDDEPYSSCPWCLFASGQCQCGPPFAPTPVHEDPNRCKVCGVVAPLGASSGLEPLCQVCMAWEFFTMGRGWARRLVRA